jgi:hypothetical protein
LIPENTHTLLKNSIDLMQSNATHSLQTPINNFNGYQNERTKQQAFDHNNINAAISPTPIAHSSISSLEQKVLHDEISPNAGWKGGIEFSTNNCSIADGVMSLSTATTQATVAKFDARSSHTGISIFSNSFSLPSTETGIEMSEPDATNALDISKIPADITASCDETNINQLFHSRASETLMNFLSELRKNHEAAMEQSFGQVVRGNASVVIDERGEVPSTSFIQGDAQRNNLSVRTVSGSSSLSNQSTLDHSLVSSVERNNIPTEWNRCMKYTSMRDLDTVSSISGDTGSSNDRGKTESGGATNESHETDSNSSSEGNASLTEGHYIGSSNTSGNNSSDDEHINSLPQVEQTPGYMTSSLTGPLRKRLKHFKEDCGC